MMSFILNVKDWFVTAASTIRDWFVTYPWLYAVAACAVVLIAVIIAVGVIGAKRRKRRRKERTELSATASPEEQSTETTAEEAAVETAPEEQVVEPVIEKVQSTETTAEERTETSPVHEEAKEPEAAIGQYTTETEAPRAVADSVAVKEQTPVRADEQPLPPGSTVRTADSEGWYVRTLYNRSFEAKLIQSDDTVKEFYSVLKNELLAYDAVARISWKHEAFRFGRSNRAKFVIRGKTLCLCLALDPAAYSESKYLVDDMSRFVSFAKTPLLYRIKNKRRCRYAAELIAELFGSENRTEREEENFADIPYRDTPTLVEEGLIKVVRTERVRIVENQIPVSEVDVEDEEDMGFEDEVDEMDEVEASEVGGLMADDFAKCLISEGSAVSDKTRQCIVNVDILGKYFEEGETVNLAALKERVPFIDKKATYVKVLARGVLGKALVVVADDFSLEAVKMIALTGGRPVRNRRK